MVRIDFRPAKHASRWMQTNQGGHPAGLFQVWFRTCHECQKVTWSSPSGLWKTSYHPPWLGSWDEQQTSLVVLLKYGFCLKCGTCIKALFSIILTAIFRHWQFSITQSATQTKNILSKLLYQPWEWFCYYSLSVLHHKPAAKLHGKCSFPITRPIHAYIISKTSLLSYELYHHCGIYHYWLL